MGRTFREAVNNTFSYLSWKNAGIQFVVTAIFWWAYRYVVHKDVSFQSVKAAVIYGFVFVISFWFAQAIRNRRLQRAIIKG